MGTIEIEETLASCELFKGLEHSEIKNIAKICRVESYEAGECVYQQGDFGEHLYIIAEGKVILERGMNIGPRDGKVVIAMLGKGRVFGCWTLAQVRVGLRCIWRKRVAAMRCWLMHRKPD